MSREVFGQEIIDFGGVGYGFLIGIQISPQTRSQIRYAMWWLIILSAMF